MTTEDAGEAGKVETTQAAPEAAVLSQDDDSAFEAEARELGWVPEAEYKGTRRPEKFKSAREFIEDMPPYVRKLLEKQEAKFNDRLSRIEKVNAKTVDQLTKQHEKQIADLTEARKQAVADGDAAEVARLSDELADKKANAPEKADDDDAKAEEDFAARNTWYGEDPTLTAAAEAFSRQIAKRYYDKHGQQMPYAENLKQVEDKIKASADYKAKFPNDKPAANGHAAVDGGGEGGPPSRTDPFARLSNAERAKAADDMKKYPKIYPTKQSWVDAYTS